jgi:hypothetical protein
LVHVPLGELGIPLRPQDQGLTRLFRELGDMVSDVKPMVFPSKDVGGEFVRKIFGGGLRLYPEKIAKKIPMGLNSKQSFTKVDEDGNVADRVRVEMMEFKPVKIKKATEEGASGESQTPFRKMVE